MLEQVNKVNIAYFASCTKIRDMALKIHALVKVRDSQTTQSQDDSGIYSVCLQNIESSMQKKEQTT